MALSTRQKAIQPIVAAALLAGMTQAKALERVGYTHKTALYSSTDILKNLRMGDFLENWRQGHAEEQLEQLTRGNVSGQVLEECLQTIRSVAVPAVRAKLMLDYVRIATTRSQDLLDRAGVSKISKSMRITSSVNAGSIADVQGRIQAVRDRLDGKAVPMVNVANNVQPVVCDDAERVSSVMTGGDVSHDGADGGEIDASQDAVTGQDADTGPDPKTEGGGGSHEGTIDPHNDIGPSKLLDIEP